MKGGGELGVELNNIFVLAEEILIGRELGAIVVFAKGLEGGQGRLDHGNIFGAEDGIEDLEDVGSDEDDIFVEFFDEGSEDL